jgi:hypothetical protein
MHPLLTELVALDLMHASAATAAARIGLAAEMIPGAEQIGRYVHEHGMARFDEAVRVHSMQRLQQHTAADPAQVAELQLRLIGWRHSFGGPIRQAIADVGDVYARVGAARLQDEMGTVLGAQRGLAQQMAEQHGQTRAGLEAMVQAMAQSARGSTHLQAAVQKLQQGQQQAAQRAQRAQQLRQEWQLGSEARDARMEFKLERILDTLQEQDRAAQQARSEAEQRAAYVGRYQAVGSAFRALGSMGNPHWARVGAMGEAATEIALQVALLQGCVPGIAAPTGLALLGPYAAIAMAAASLFMALKQKRRAGQDPVAAQLQQLAQNVERLRQQMHTRFDQLGEQLGDLGCKLDAGFVSLERVVRFESTVLGGRVSQQFEQAAANMQAMHALAQAHANAAVAHNLRVLVDQMLDLCGGDAARLAVQSAQLRSQRQTKLIDQLLTVEQSHMLTQLCLPTVNGAVHVPQAAHLTPAQWTTMQQLASHVFASIHSGAGLAFLGALLTGPMQVPLAGVSAAQAASLPHLQLFGMALDASLETRVLLQQQYQFVPDPARLIRIRAALASAHTFLVALHESRAVVFDRLIALYQSALVDAEEKLVAHVQQAWQQGVADGETVTLGSIPTGQISLRGATANFPPLPVQHLQALCAGVSVPGAAAQLAKLGLGRFEATYSSVLAQATHATAHHGEGGSHHWPTFRRPVDSTFNIQLEFVQHDGARLPLFTGLQTSTAHAEYYLRTTTNNRMSTTTMQPSPHTSTRKTVLCLTRALRRTGLPVRSSVRQSLR